MEKRSEVMYKKTRNSTYKSFSTADKTIVSREQGLNRLLGFAMTILRIERFHSIAFRVQMITSSRIIGKRCLVIDKKSREKTGAMRHKFYCS